MVANGKLYMTIMEKLNYDPRLDAANITVSIKGNNDVVMLAGCVKTFIEKSIAERAVRSLEAVKAIVNEIKVEPSIKYKRTDIEIAEAIINALKWNVTVPEDRIKVVVEDGIVTLSGEVEWQHQKNSAVQAASTIWGIKSVINNIMVKPSVTIDPSKVKEQIRKEFERHAVLDADKVQVEVEGRTIILTGAVRNLEEMDEAIDASWAIPGVAEVKNKLTIE